jgi:hypothetical protein
VTFQSYCAKTHIAAEQLCQRSFDFAQDFAWRLKMAYFAIDSPIELRYSLAAPRGGNARIFENQQLATGN